MPFSFQNFSCLMMLLACGDGDARHRGNAEGATKPGTDEAARPPQDEYG